MSEKFHWNTVFNTKTILLDIVPILQNPLLFS